MSVRKNVLLTLAYDGTNYCGWQLQKNAVTVQQRLDEALYKCFGIPIETRGASRTDSGVHAQGQRVKFTVDTTVPAEKMSTILNRYLPEDIVVTKAVEVSDDFHPLFSAVMKAYEYKILNDSEANPLVRNFTALVKKPLDISKMSEACQYFLGTHDFKAFSNKGGNQKTSTRTIYSLTVSKQEKLVTIAVAGDGFLYNMVRIMASNLIRVGLSKFPPEHIQEIILSKDRSKAGDTLTPKGLTLVDIFYERGAIDGK